MEVRMFRRANATQTVGSAKHASSTAARWLVAVAIGVAAPLGAEVNNKPDALGRIVGALVAPGVRITPTATPHSTFETLDPDISADPGVRANQGVTTTTSPDGRTLLVLTSGYNYCSLSRQNNTVLLRRVRLRLRHHWRKSP